MTWREFEDAFNVRTTERCCETCKHGERGYEGEADCKHPRLKGECFRGGWINDVCDLWEKCQDESEVAK